MNLYPDISKVKYICIDVETKDPGIKTDRLSAIKKEGYVLGFSVGTDDGFKAYYPLRHPGEGNVDKRKAVAWLKKQMLNNVPKVGANILYDLEWLWHDLGVKVNGQKICVQAIEALLDENKKSYSLDNLAKQRLGLAKEETALYDAADRIGIDHKEIKANLWQMTADEVRAYGEGDADLPIKILLNQLPEINNQGMQEVYNLECDVLDVLFEMRKNGVRVDLDYADQLKKKFTKEEKDARKRLRGFAGREIDVWSGQDLADGANKLGLKFPLTAKQNPSFTGDWLKEQVEPYYKTVSEVRRYNRILEVFVKSKVLDMAYSGRIYPSYFSTRNDFYGTVTGRLSSANPNMQQIPARDEELAPMIRAMFLPEQGENWETFDYSQQEPRVTVHFAYICKLLGADKARQRYIDNPDTDYHQMVADMAGITRKHAKTINLGLSYGMGKTKLAMELGLPLQEAAPVFDKYHDAVPFVRLLLKRCASLAESRGYIKTILGRRRHFELWGPTTYEKGVQPCGHQEAVEIWGPSVVRYFTYRAGNNMVQGSSADMVKKAAVDIFKAIGKAPIVTVHDENDYSNKDPKVTKVITECMLNAVKLEVPLKVDHETGPNWGAAK